MVSQSDVSFHVLTNDCVYNVSHYVHEVMSCVKYHHLDKDSCTSDLYLFWCIIKKNDILSMTVIDWCGR